MTGGIGFTKQGQVSNRNNRNLQKGLKRSAGDSSGYEDPKVSNYDEVKKWKEEKQLKERKAIRLGILILSSRNYRILTFLFYHLKLVA